MNENLTMIMKDTGMNMSINNKEINKIQENMEESIPTNNIELFGTEGQPKK